MILNAFTHYSNIFFLGAPHAPIVPFSLLWRLSPPTETDSQSCRSQGEKESAQWKGGSACTEEGRRRRKEEGGVGGPTSLAPGKKRSGQG